MPDGGMAEDFLHVAGLMQALVSNGGMRPFILVGIENTQRRRDMTGPTTNPEDRKIADVVGGSARFRSFIAEELMPTIKARYRTTQETAIIGESLAGLFVVETFVRAPDMFDTCIAIDPSLWWNHSEFVNPLNAQPIDFRAKQRSIYLASSSEPELARLTAQLASILAEQQTPGGLRVHYTPLPTESHATVYHPAALQAFRTVLAPPGPRAYP